MQRNRVLIAFGIAWLSALLLSWWVYKTATAPQKRELTAVLAAAHDLPLGKRLAAADLKLVTVDRKDLPQGAFHKLAELADRAVAVPMGANELVLERKLAARGSGEGLAALIEPGMRAIAVQVNEMSGVAGFAQPGTRVDVLFTRIAANGDAATTTILQNIKVIAYGRQLEPGGKLDARPSSTAQTVATLLVTQEQAEKLALAVQRGRIQLALRNPLDTKLAGDSKPVRSTDLGIDEVGIGRPRGASAPVALPLRNATRGNPAGPAKTPDPSKAQTDGRVVIKVYRGAKVSEEVFQ